MALGQWLKPRDSTCARHRRVRVGYQGRPEWGSVRLLRGRQLEWRIRALAWVAEAAERKGNGGQARPVARGVAWRK